MSNKSETAIPAQQSNENEHGNGQEVSSEENSTNSPLSTKKKKKITEIKTPPPPKDPSQKKDPLLKMELQRKGSLILRAKKNVASKVVSSKLGRKAMPTEARALLKALRKIIEKVESGKKAEDVERNMLKIIVKAKILIENKNLSLVDFLKADVPLRQAFDIFAELFDYYGEGLRIQRLQNKFQRAASLLREVQVISAAMLKPHLQPKSLARLDLVFDFLADPSLYNKIWTNQDLYLELFLLVNSMSKYTQFHYDV